MIARSKRYKNSAKDLSPDEELSLTDALGGLLVLGKRTSMKPWNCRFHWVLTPSRVLWQSGVRNLPNGSGKEIRVLSLENQMKLFPQVLTSWLDDLISKIKDGWLDFTWRCRRGP